MVSRSLRTKRKSVYCKKCQRQTYIITKRKLFSLKTFYFLQSPNYCFCFFLVLASKNKKKCLIKDTNLPTNDAYVKNCKSHAPMQLRISITLFQIEQYPYFRMYKIPISDYKRSLFQTKKGPYFRLNNVPISDYQIPI